MEGSGKGMMLDGNSMTIGWIEEFIRDGMVVDGMKDS
jgi:hypothetical protein